MLALSRLAITLDSDEDEPSLKLLQTAIPQMVAVLKQAVDEGDEDRTTQSFEVGRIRNAAKVVNSADSLSEGFSNPPWLRFFGSEQTLWRYCAIHDQSRFSDISGRRL